MPLQSDAERIADLEVQIAHQAKILDELNEIVRAQWAEIDKLTRTATHLADRLLTVEEGARKSGPGNEPPPPHY
mgnify:CR=1 FL=1